MKFRFCGDQDCPDWLLAEMTTLSRLTSVKTRLVAAQIVQAILTEPSPGLPSSANMPDMAKLFKFSSDAQFSSGDLLAGSAALVFILQSSAKYEVPTNFVETELQQLGLPKEHSTAIGKVYTDNYSKLVDTLKRGTLKLTTNVEIVEWSVETLQPSLETENIDTRVVKMKVKYWSFVSNKEEVKQLIMPPIQFRVFLADMRKAQTLIKDLQ